MKISVTTLGGTPGKPVLVVGPSLGTAAATLWSGVTAALADDFEVLGWDLPGHGGSPVTHEPFELADVADAVADSLSAALADRGVAAAHYAGDSFGASVGLVMLLEQPDLLRTATLCCTGAQIATPASWHERAAAVRAEGTATLAAGSRQRWFAAGFTGRAAEVLLAQLAEVDDESYAVACEALARFDLRSRLRDIRGPVLAVAGACDPATPPEKLREIALGVADGELVVLPGVAHLAPAETPERVAALITEHALRPRSTEAVRAAGMATRRAVLGDVHVDRATANADDFTREFQSFITQYAWGSIWTRPGLARRDRSLITLTALVALGHDEELAMHVRAARRNGLSVDEIKELLLQTAIYCGVPAANTAFRVAQRVLAEDAAEHADEQRGEHQ